MDPSKALEILAQRRPQTMAELALSRPESLSAQVVDLTSGQVERINDRPGPGHGPAIGAAEVEEGAVDHFNVALRDLKSKGVTGLVGEFKSVQADRVAQFAEYNRRFQQALEKSDLQDYPAIVSWATERFQVMSCRARAVIELLGRHDSAAMLGLVKRVQELEAENLTVTAAMHLDRVRLHLEVESRPELLVEGVAKNEERLGEIKLEIAKLMEEIQCELVDEAAAEAGE